MRDIFATLLEASLEWSSTEQSFFWQLVGAHELPTKHFLPLISLVDGQKHSEACSQLLLLLQLEKCVFLLNRLFFQVISCTRVCLQIVQPQVHSRTSLLRRCRSVALGYSDVIQDFQSRTNSDCYII